MTVKVSHINGLLILAVTALTLSYQACSDATSGFKANHASGGIANAAGGTTTDNPKPTLSLAVDPFTAPSNPQILLCVSEIRIGKDDDRVILDGTPRWIELNPKGTLVNPDLKIPAGSYNQMEIRLDDKCSGASVDVINSHGHFELSDRIDVKFAGTVTVSAQSDHIDLDMSKIVSAIGQAKSSSEVEDALKSSSGGCSGD